jgi:hypothetical protein
LRTLDIDAGGVRFTGVIGGAGLPLYKVVLA